jgi:hypothetical protein
LFHSKEQTTWWKFWKPKGKIEDNKRDSIVYVKGLHAMLDNEDWCSTTCDLTVSMDKIKTDKFKWNEVSSSGGEKKEKKKASSIKKFIKSPLKGLKKLKNLFS